MQISNTALEIADELEIPFQADFHKVCEQAAIELRYLHALVTRLTADRPYPELPKPQGYVAYEAEPYQEAWTSSEPAYTETQMHVYVSADRVARTNDQ
jgi:hypothetical protein